ncbi:MAG: RidA family protein [Chloroflexi bacterium]|nr:RidA family protein [Chloroflexota bacterium]
MELERRIYSNLPQPLGAYSHAVKAGNFLFVSGFTARGTPAENGDVVAQLEELLKRLQLLLSNEGATLKNVAKVNIYVTDISRFQELQEVRRRYFAEGLPASTMVEVKGLARPNLKVELEAVAVLP